MSEAQNPAPVAHVRRRRRLDWIWVVPSIALLIVLWLAWRNLMSQGPEITITFDSASGIEAGSTRVRYRDVDVGTVERVGLTSDLSHVVVTARMRRQVATHLGTDARFWIVRPRVTAGGISGLETIVSGTYIAMIPSKAEGPAIHDFVGLNQGPVIETGEAGRIFYLRTTDVHSLNQGSYVYYHGLTVGQIQRFELIDGGSALLITAFVRAPYDALVRPDSRWWKISSLNISAGPGGLHASMASLQELFAGGVSFATPAEAMNEAEAAPESHFILYGDKDMAEAIPAGPVLTYTLEFPGPVGGIGIGSPVELEGINVGRVSSVGLQYNPATQTLSTPVTIEIDPTRLTIRTAQGASPATRQVAELALEHLVEQGLRARLASGNLLTGQRLVALELAAPPHQGHLLRVGDVVEIPTVPSDNLDDLTHSATNLIQHLNTLTTSRDLKRSLHSLDETLANLDRVSQTASRELGPTMDSLRQTSDAAHGTLTAADRTLGGQQAQTANLPQLINELSDTARAVRILAEYLDAHPEAILRGRATDPR